MSKFLYKFLADYVTMCSTEDGRRQKSLTFALMNDVLVAVSQTAAAFSSGGPRHGPSF